MQIQWMLTATVSVLTLISGALWIRSATSKVIHDEEKLDEDGLHPMAIVEHSNGENIDILETARLQSKWNKWAAGFAGVAALLQAVSTFYFSHA